MTDSSSKLPKRVPLPIEIGGESDDVLIWSGHVEMKQGAITRSGDLQILLQMTSRPRLAFEFQNEERTLDATDLFRAFSEGNLDDWEIQCDEYVGVVIGSPSLDRTTEMHGDVFGHEIDEKETYVSATFLVLNGPKMADIGLELENGGGFVGRTQVEIDDVTFTVDQLSPETFKTSSVYCVTHVAQVKSENGLNWNAIQQSLDRLFLALSLAKGRWVGLAGVWLFSKDGEPQKFYPWITKVSQRGGSLTWFDERLRGAVGQLLLDIHVAYAQPKREEALQTAIHWLVESSLCAGGVEGSILLQQAAFEALAWFEVVEERKLCSTYGFTGLPASDKIRLLASLHSISTRIPDHANGMLAYQKAYESDVKDFADMLVDVRNALVHSSPKKLKRIRRPSANEELTELWQHSLCVLQQLVLAVVGYQGGEDGDDKF